MQSQVWTHFGLNNKGGRVDKSVTTVCVKLAKLQWRMQVANLMTHSKRRHRLAVRQSAPVPLFHLQLTGAPAREKNVKIFLQTAALKAELKPFTKVNDYGNKTYP